jgi:gentisate 1,2-dioxygenase
MSVSQVYKSDARTMRKIKALLEKVDITLDEHLDYTCAVFDEEGEPLSRHDPEKSRRKRPQMVPLSRRKNKDNKKSQSEDND